MIERLTGKICARTPQGVVLDVNGVGYGVEVPLSTLCALPAGDETVQLWIETYVREDALRLFGFSTHEEKRLFVTLRSISGVGPKTALAMISAMTPTQLRLVVLRGQQEMLEKIPGIGKKLAERLLLELRSKFEKERPGGVTAQAAATTRESDDQSATSPLLPDANSTTIEFDDVLLDVRSALENFGYKDKELQPVLARLRLAAPEKQHETGALFAELLKSALGDLRSRSVGVF